ncbi:NUDIX hydrolase [Saccharopolyspora sp. NFXS83]|uniref:NUDIX hydrolase n=1 Tax=Saccharopolyspora sp. NFXS83 TaxID=2993560 RepID=UPI00224AFA13|nr:NUDIX hydrolase [Saccharopolyspora sp. NFXS83]MCX2729453.1 NUDIX hydrolase [Saccharopolyspora sp. NFXS83]
MNDGIRLVVLDGELLGTVAGQQLGAALTAASPLAAATVADVLRRTLLPRAQTTPDLIQQLATELALPPKKVRTLLHAPRPLLLVPTARALLTGLRDACPNTLIVVCANLAAADTGHGDLIRAELGPLLDATHFSFRTGHTTGSGPDLYEFLSDCHQVAVAEMIHVSHHLHDLHIALLAGCRALHISSGPDQPPGPAGLDRYRATADLLTAITELQRWIPASQPRPTLPVRAAALVRNTAGELLIVRGPDDEKFCFPGGRCKSLGPDAPPQAMVRELHEQLRLSVTPGRLLWAGSSESETSTGESKIHFLFEAHLRGTTVPDPDPTEIADYCWATNNDALHLLHASEADRLVRITRGQHHGWQRRRPPAHLTDTGFRC